MLNTRQSGIALLTTMLILMLMSSLLVGFVILIMTDQRLGGINSDRTQSFYAAEAGMEKMTADLGTLFGSTFAPSSAQLNNITLNPPPLPGVQYRNPDGTSGYQLNFPRDGNGNPLAQNRTILSGPYQGLIALITPFTLTVTAHTINGSEVKLLRTTQAVAIPAFQFGVFSQTNLSFFAGPNFNFGGRVHTNDHLLLAEGGGSTLTMADRVTAVGEVIRTNLSNGWPTSSNYTGTVNVTTAPGSGAVRALASSEGSLVGTLGSALNEPTWPNLSIGTYNGNIRNGRTGARNLDLAIVALGATSPIEIIRRPAIPPQPPDNAGILGQRYFAQASMKILLSDTAAEITSLPCIDNGTPPVDLNTLAGPVSGLPPWYTGGNPAPIPLATSFATGPNYPSNGYWIQAGKPLINGFIKIEIQTAAGVPCGAWQDVTAEILRLGIAGRNVNPDPALYVNAPALQALPPSGTQVAPSACADPHPNAVIRLERVRDNPSTANVGVPTSGNYCGFDNAGNPSLVPTDYWPNALFDPREGGTRDVCPDGTNPCTSQQLTLSGVMPYLEIDVNNLARWLTGAIGANGTRAFDPANSSNDFAIYVSDRRGNRVDPLVNAKVGEYGYEDFVTSSSQFGCPNGQLDSGEDLVGDGQLRTYGGPPLTTLLDNAGNNIGLVGAPALAPNANCALAGTTWPGAYYANSQDARINPPLVFRRAVKLLNGSSINLGVCPNTKPCGLTVATENPVYVQGDFNSTGGTFNGAHVASSVVADALTFLSNRWNDVNSFISPYRPGARLGITTWYRLAVLADKGVSFPQPTGYPTPQDFGTDGGMHNFLRYVENWGGQQLNYRGSIVSLYYNRQGAGVYKCCFTVYSPPSRGYNFDTEFLQPSLLPPRTPMFHDINTTGFTQLVKPTQ
jgi:hypothetical protein